MKGNWIESIVPGGIVYKYIYDQENEIMYCNPTPTSEEIEWWYNHSFNYMWYSRHRLLKRIQGIYRFLDNKKTIRKYISFKESNYLLDIGCGHGWFLREAMKNGFKTFGIDYKSEATEHAKRLGIIVYEGNIETLDLKYNFFNIVSMWHSLEHMINPKNVLKKINHIIAIDGLLMIAVPNLKCRGVDRRGIQWVWIQQPFVHIWHWSKKSLCKLLEETGFEVLEIMTCDTWDANILFDGYLNPLFERIVNGIAKRIDNAFRYFGFKKSNYFKDYVAFYIIEGTRILCYIYCLAISKISKDNYRRSELIIFARKKRQQYTNNSY